MALTAYDQSPMDGGSRSWQELQDFKAKQAGAAQSSYLGNLGRFFMYAGTGMAQGIGQGLAATDLRNPFRGAGMALVGGSEMGQRASMAQMQMDEARAGMPLLAEQERMKQALRLEEYQSKLNADLEQEKKMLGTFKGMPKRQQEEEMEDRGEMKIGTSYLSPAGKVFLAQQGLATAEAARLLSGVRSGVRGMA